MTRIASLFALFALAACGGSPHGSTILREESTGITVMGDGRAEATPDLAIFQVGIEIRRPTVDEARQAAAQSANAVLEALRGAGVEENMIRTQRLSIAPDYEYTEQGRRLLGYLATNSVEVRLRQLDRVSAALDAAVRAGGDAARVDGVRFELENPDEVRNAAREQAVSRARAQAEQLARLAGVELGAPMAIEETSGGGMPQPVMMRMAEAAQSDAATPLQPGQTEVMVQVRVRFAIR